MTIAYTRETRAAAIQSVLDGAEESTDLWSGQDGCNVAFVRDRRGIVEVRSSTDGTRISERVASRADRVAR
jgi:hypothetical protein